MLEALDSWVIQVVAISTIIIAVVYVYFKISYSYWEKRGIPTLAVIAPFGNFADVILSGNTPDHRIEELYKEFEGHKVGGLYRFANPSLLARDTDIIKDVLTRDFDHFHTRGFKSDEESEPLDAHLFSLSGEKWRNLRVNLTPVFTSGKMKFMFETVAETAKELQTCLQKLANKGETIEIKDYLARYSTDVISSCAFGIQCNCLKNPDAEFRNWGRKMFAPSIKRRFASLLNMLFPTLVLKLKLSIIPKDVSNYFRKMVKETVEYRENNNTKRNDFLQLLIQMKNKTLGGAEDEDMVLDKEIDELKTSSPFKVTMDVIAAQSFVFYIAGFETSSTTMTFCLYEMALNPDIQERVQAEIDTVLEKHGGNVTYESIFEMQYLDKVVNETLRKYPPVIVLIRECTKPTKIRGTDLTMEKGVQVIISVKGLHHDPKYYPDPEKFDPERFSEDEKKKRPKYSFLPFGEGPRICIGMRFGLMQTKMGIISILSKYDVRVSEKTPIPLVYDPKTFLLTTTGGMWLKIVNREDRSD